MEDFDRIALRCDALRGKFDNVACGTVYKLSRSGAGYTESILYRFSGGRGDGGLAIFTTGARCSRRIFLASRRSAAVPVAVTTVAVSHYEFLVQSALKYTEEILYAFKGDADGAFPSGALTLGAAGELLGATLDGRGAPVTTLLWDAARYFR